MTVFLVSNSSDARCPTDSSLTWRFWNGSAWVGTSPVVASCPPPGAPQPPPSPLSPAACVCDKIKLASPGLWWSGVYTRQPNLIYLGRPVFKNGNSYLYYSSDNLEWQIGSNFLDSARHIATSRTNAQCPDDDSLAWWSWDGEGWEFIDPAVADCQSPPSIPPINQPPAWPVPPRPPPWPPILPVAALPPSAPRSPLSECGCSTILVFFSNAKLAFLSGKYEASTALVGGRRSYASNDYYLFYSEGVTDWFISNSLESSGGWLKSDNDDSYCPVNVRSWFIGVDGGWTLDPEVSVSCFIPVVRQPCGCESFTVAGLPSHLQWLSGVYEKTGRESFDDSPVYERAGMLLYFWPLTERWQLGEHY
eukprot:3472634-Pleurochrysis_carterae.AAC.1